MVSLRNWKKEFEQLRNVDFGSYIQENYGETLENLTSPLFVPKRGNSSVWKMEGWMDFTDRRPYYFENVNKINLG